MKLWILVKKQKSVNMIDKARRENHSDQKRKKKGINSVFLREQKLYYMSPGFSIHIINVSQFFVLFNPDFPFGHQLNKGIEHTLGGRGGDTKINTTLT